MKPVAIVIVIIIALCAFGAFIDSQQKKAPPKKTQFYIGETLSISGLEIKVTDVKEKKQIGKFKAKNTFLQTFVNLKNTASSSKYLPFSIALIHRKDDSWICLPDERFKNGLDKTEYVAGGFTVFPGQELNAQIIFSCDNYLNEKAGANKSKPSDFKLFAYNKQENDGGYIFLEKAQ